MSGPINLKEALHKGARPFVNPLFQRKRNAGFSEIDTSSAFP